MSSHVYPINDLREHDTESGGCWCNPQYDEEHDLFIHNSMDRREEYEEGRKPTQPHAAPLFALLRKLGDNNDHNTNPRGSAAGA